MGEAVHVLEGFVGLDYPFDMLRVDEIASLALSKVTLLGGVYEEDFAAAVGGLGLVEDADGDGDAGAGEEVGGQADDGLEQVRLDDALAYLALGAAAEEDAVGHDHADHALGVGDAEHVHEEGQVAPGLGRDGVVAVEAVMGVVGGEVVAPVLEAEGRIGDDAVVG